MSGKTTEESADEYWQTVCVRPEHVRKCVVKLEITDVEVASVVGFHEGTYPTAYKVH